MGRSGSWVLHDCMIMTLKYIQHKMKENLFLLRDLSEPWNIYKHMITVSKSVYNDKLDEIVDTYNNT